MRCIRELLSRLNGGHPRKNPSEKFGCDASRKFVTRLGKDLQYSPSLVPSCTRSRSNFSDEVFFLGCRNLGMICIKIRHNIKGEESPSLQPWPRPYSHSLREYEPKPAPARSSATPTAGAQTPHPQRPGLTHRAPRLATECSMNIFLFLLKLPYKCVESANCRVN